MLKFFRRIRQKLLNEGSLSKYLLYAIGEILLVVIGILLAIQLNKASESRKDGDQLDQHFQEIKADLLDDLKDWQVKYDQAWTGDREGMYLLNFLKEELEEVPDTIRLRNAFIQANVSFELSPNRIAFENLVSSGHLQLVENKELRLLLDNYYVFESQGTAQRERHRQILSDERFNYIDPLMLREYYIKQLNSDVPSEAQFESYKINWMKLKKTDSFKQALSQFLALNIPRFRYLNRRKGEIERLLELIDEELNN